VLPSVTKLFHDKLDFGTYWGVMKSTRRIQSILLSACTLTFLTVTASAQSFDAGQVARNAALQASPRYVELQSQPRSHSHGIAAPSQTARARQHSGLAASPRGIEDIQATQAVRPVTELAKRASPTGAPHSGFAASPRGFEELQPLGIQGATVMPTQVYEIAPLK